MTLEKCLNFLSRQTLSEVIHSGKLRAGQTAEYFVKNLSSPSLLIINDNISPNQTLKSLIKQKQSWDNDILIVGYLTCLANIIAPRKVRCI